MVSYNILQGQKVEVTEETLTTAIRELDSQIELAIVVVVYGLDGVSGLRLVKR